MLKKFFHTTSKLHLMDFTQFKPLDPKLQNPIKLVRSSIAYAAQHAKHVKVFHPHFALTLFRLIWKDLNNLQSNWILKKSRDLLHLGLKFYLRILRVLIIKWISMLWNQWQILDRDFDIFFTSIAIWFEFLGLLISIGCCEYSALWNRKYSEIKKSSL